MKEQIDNKSDIVVDESKPDSKTTVRVSGAEAVVKCLLEENVEIVFGYAAHAPWLLEWHGRDREAYLTQQTTEIGIRVVNLLQYVQNGPVE